MGPKEIAMIAGAAILLVAVTFALNWAKSRSGNSNSSNKNQS